MLIIVDGGIGLRWSVPERSIVLRTPSQDQLESKFVSSPAELGRASDLLAVGCGREDALVIGVQRLGTSVFGQPSTHQVKIGFDRFRVRRSEP